MLSVRSGSCATRGTGKVRLKPGYSKSTGWADIKVSTVYYPPTTLLLVTTTDRRTEESSENFCG